MCQKEGVIIYQSEQDKGKGTARPFNPIQILLCNRSVNSILGFQGWEENGVPRNAINAPSFHFKLAG
jgi:hypothetical protein